MALENQEKAAVLAVHPQAYVDRVVTIRGPIFYIDNSKGYALSTDCDTAEQAWSEAAQNLAAVDVAKESH